MVINTNIAALQITTNLTKVNRGTESSMQRLSSGRKINKVSDDPAILSVSNSLNSQIRGMTAASRNALDGISIMQTADGALGEITSIIQRMRELAVQASNGTMTADDRAKLQTEIDELTGEIDSMVDRTEFNAKKLINGELGRYMTSRHNSVKADNIAKAVYASPSVQAGTLSYDIVNVGVPAKIAGEISPISAFSDSDFTINGVPVSISYTDTPDDVLLKIKEACLIAGVEVRAPGYPNTLPSSPLILTSKEVGKDAVIELAPAGSQALIDLNFIATSAAGYDPKVTNIDYLDKNNNSISAFMNANTINYDGNQVGILGKANEGIYFELQLQVDDDGTYWLSDGTHVNDDGTLAAPIVGMSMELTGFGPLILQVGHNQYMEMAIDIPDVSSKGLGLDNLSYRTAEGAQTAISRCDDALSTILRIRSGFGAFHNRLEFTSNNLGESIYNTEVSNSRIMDTDMAAEMTNYAKLNVISQAGIAILAQANQRPQQLLQLLR